MSRSPSPFVARQETGIAVDELPASQIQACHLDAATQIQPTSKPQVLHVRTPLPGLPKRVPPTLDVDEHNIPRTKRREVNESSPRGKKQRKIHTEKSIHKSKLPKSKPSKISTPHDTPHNPYSFPRPEQRRPAPYTPSARLDPSQLKAVSPQQMSLLRHKFTAQASILVGLPNVHNRVQAFAADEFVFNNVQRFLSTWYAIVRSAWIRFEFLDLPRCPTSSKVVILNTRLEQQFMEMQTMIYNMFCMREQAHPSPLPFRVLASAFQPPHTGFGIPPEPSPQYTSINIPQQGRPVPPSDPAPPQRPPAFKGGKGKTAAPSQDVTCDPTKNIRFRIQESPTGSFSRPYDKSILKPPIGVTQFFAWFAQITETVPPTGPESLKFTLKDAVPSPVWRVVMRDEEGALVGLRACIKRECEKAEKFVVGMDTFEVLVTVPEWGREELGSGFVEEEEEW